jgi:hypothetical protein
LSLIFFLSAKKITGKEAKVYDCRVEIQRAVAPAAAAGADAA